MEVARAVTDRLKRTPINSRETLTTREPQRPAARQTDDAGTSEESGGCDPWQWYS
jgi:hypothetical protein